jgi:hypothetical protein
MSRLERIKHLIPQEHYDVYLNTLHFVQMIDEAVESHRMLVASQAIAGIKPDGEAEEAFYEAMAAVRDNAITILEKELQDWLHAGDKNYEKNFTNDFAKYKGAILSNHGRGA